MPEWTDNLGKMMAVAVAFGGALGGGLGVVQKFLESWTNQRLRVQAAEAAQKATDAAAKAQEQANALAGLKDYCDRLLAQVAREPAERADWQKAVGTLQEALVECRECYRDVYGLLRLMRVVGQQYRAALLKLGVKPDDLTELPEMPALRVLQTEAVEFASRTAAQGAALAEATGKDIPAPPGAP